jgi:hypothetical protein
MLFRDLEHLQSVHEAHGPLVLVKFVYTPPGHMTDPVTLGGDAAALVAELIRLARFGAKVRQLAEIGPRRQARTVIAAADRCLRRQP